MAYEKLIMESCGCTATEAPVVEEFMRGEHPTLDGLSKNTIDHAGLPLDKKAYDE